MGGCGGGGNGSALSPVPGTEENGPPSSPRSAGGVVVVVVGVPLLMRCGWSADGPGMSLLAGVDGWPALVGEELDRSAASPLPCGGEVGVAVVGRVVGTGSVVVGVLFAAMAGQAKALSRLLVDEQVDETKHLLSATLAPMSQKYWRDSCMPWTRAEACLKRDA